MSAKSWDELYSRDEHYFGTDPNDFLRENARLIPKASDVLCLAAGEGRNAVFLAELGHRVTAIDRSLVGLKKLERLARERQVQIQIVHAELDFHDLGHARWDAIVSIWAHIRREKRIRLHPACVEALRPGGIFLLEALTPQPAAGAEGSGPLEPGTPMSKVDLMDELSGLHITHALELERTIQEGVAHQGRSAVVQLIGKRPK